MTLTVVWILLGLGCLFLLLGGLLHSASKCTFIYIRNKKFDFVPLSYTMYTVGGILTFISCASGFYLSVT